MSAAKPRMDRERSEKLAWKDLASKGPFVPVTLGCLVLLIMVGLTWRAGAYYTAGHFTYALDDAYIHMALAKNLALHGVLGATPFEFTSSSSSPLWTLLLALSFKVAGVRDLVPLILTTVSSLGLLICSDLVMRRFGVGGVRRLAGLLWICIATPLMAIIFGGMEHPLQILLDVAFLYASVVLIEREDVRWDRFAICTLALAALVTAVRYEGLLLVAVVGAAMALRRRWTLAASLAGAGAVPVVAYGLVSLSQGAFFLPNSVLIKSSDNLARLLLAQGPAAYLRQIIARTSGVVLDPLLLLVAANAVLLVLQEREGVTRWSGRRLFPTVAVIVSAVHLLFGQTGWFFRYEDYMIVLLAVGVLVQTPGVRFRELGTSGVFAVVGILAAALVAGSFAVGLARGRLAWDSTPRAMENVYEQMYQTAHFLRANPQYHSVAIGDLGAVAYYNNDLRILDLEGLAERGEPLASIGRLNSKAADITARAKRDRCDIAIVFPDYFDLPHDWTEVARWTISNNLVCYGPTVAFLAIPPTDPAALAADVHRYTTERLPKTVAAEGLPVAAP